MCVGLLLLSVYARLADASRWPLKVLHLAGWRVGSGYFGREPLSSESKDSTVTVEATAVRCRLMSFLGGILADSFIEIEPQGMLKVAPETSFWPGLEPACKLFGKFWALHD